MQSSSLKVSQGKTAVLGQQEGLCPSMAQLPPGRWWGAGGSPHAPYPYQGSIYLDLPSSSEKPEVSPSQTHVNTFSGNKHSAWAPGLSSAGVHLTLTASFIPTESSSFCPALPEPGLVKGMELQNKSPAGRQGTGRGKAYGELYFRGQKSVTMWRRIASDNE